MVNAKNIKVWIMVFNFYTHDMIFFANGKRKQNIVNCITSWEYGGEEMFLNK